MMSNAPVQVYIRYRPKDRCVRVDSCSSGNVLVTEHRPTFLEYLDHGRWPPRSPLPIIRKYKAFAKACGPEMEGLRDAFWEVCLTRATPHPDQIVEFEAHVSRTIASILTRGADSWGEKYKYYRHHLGHVMASYLWPPIHVFYEFKDAPRARLIHPGHGVSVTELRSKLMAIDDKVKTMVKREVRVSDPFGLGRQYRLSLRFVKPPAMTHQTFYEIKQSIRIAVSLPFDVATLLALEGRLLRDHSGLIVDRVGLLIASPPGAVRGVSETEEVHKCKGDGVWVFSVMKMFEWTRWTVMQQQTLASVFVSSPRLNRLPVESEERVSNRTTTTHMSRFILNHGTEADLSTEIVARAKQLLILVSVPIERLFVWYTAAAPSFPASFSDSVVLMAVHAYHVSTLRGFLARDDVLAGLDALGKELHYKLSRRLGLCAPGQRGV